MAGMKTPEQIAAELDQEWMQAQIDENPRSTAPFEMPDTVALMVKAIVADRAQRTDLLATVRLASGRHYRQDGSCDELQEAVDALIAGETSPA